MIIPHRHVHIVGAGGAGMSALAKLLAGNGHTVTGSDLKAGPELDVLEALGMEIAVGHHPELAVAADLIVASSAVPHFDEEIQAASEAGLPVWRRPDLLEAITAGIETIGATGTHGKTTTTALLISALRAAGNDPSFVVGGELVDLGTNGHVGSMPLLVLEADEAFRTFESLHLTGLVVTNVEPEHVGHFGSDQELIDSFVSVARGVDGPVVACIDDQGAAEVASSAGSFTYGLDEAADWRLVGLASGPSGSAFRLEGRLGEADVRLSRPGRHVALNAAGALALLAEKGFDPQVAADGLHEFRGVSRRWEFRGSVSGVDLYDDYAHHPTEVAAMVSMALEVARGRLVAVFQPHLYSRTELFSAGFGAALAGADVVVVTDVFGAREEPVPGVTGELVLDAARESGAVDAHYVPHRADLAEYLAGLVRPGDLVLSMGAGDITLLHGELAPMLGAGS